jgi:hypothetical protein
MLYRKIPFGIDVLPNREFWAAIPGLVVDGVKFIIGKIQACRSGNPSAEGYGNL